MVSLELRVGEKELSWLWIRLELQNSHVCLSQMSPTVSQSYSYWNHKNEAFTFIIISFKWRILCHLKLTFTASVTKELLGFVCLIVFLKQGGLRLHVLGCILGVCIMHVNTMTHGRGENAENRSRWSSVVEALYSMCGCCFNSQSWNKRKEKNLEMLKTWP